MSLIKKIASSVLPSKGSLKALILGGAVCGAFATAPARAALLLTVSEPGFAPAFGTPSSPNTIDLIGPYGDFNTNIVIGFTNSNTPTSVAELQIQSLQVIDNSNTGPKTLTISLTDTGFTFPGSPGQTLLMTSSIGGTFTQPVAGDKLTFQSSATPGGGGPIIAVSTPVQSYTAPSNFPGAVAVTVPDQTALFPATGGYSLSNQLTLSLSSNGETANLSGSTTVAVAAVPEPTCGAITAVAAVGLLRRRRRAS
jgi:hypothetical protein